MPAQPHSYFFFHSSEVQSVLDAYEVLFFCHEKMKLLHTHRCGLFENFSACWGLDSQPISERVKNSNHVEGSMPGKSTPPFSKRSLIVPFPRGPFSTAKSITLPTSTFKTLSKMMGAWIRSIPLDLIDSFRQRTRFKTNSAKELDMDLKLITILRPINFSTTD